MAESAHKSSDIPDFDTYPATPSDELIEYKGIDRVSTNRPSLEKTSLEQRAAELGAAAGKLVRVVRQARETLGTLPGRPVFDRITEVAERARARAEHLRSLAAHRAEDLTQAARDKASELKSRVSEKTADLGWRARTSFRHARRHAEQTVRQYPVHVAVAAGAVGFLAGVALRIRRANRA